MDGGVGVPALALIGGRPTGHGRTHWEGPGLVKPNDLVHLLDESIAY